MQQAPVLDCVYIRGMIMQAHLLCRRLAAIDAPADTVADLKAQQSLFEVSKPGCGKHVQPEHFKLNCSCVQEVSGYSPAAPFSQTDAKAALASLLGILSVHTDANLTESLVHSSFYTALLKAITTLLIEVRVVTPLHQMQIL